MRGLCEPRTFVFEGCALLSIIAAFNYERAVCLQIVLASLTENEAGAVIPLVRGWPVWIICCPCQ